MEKTVRPLWAFPWSWPESVAISSGVVLTGLLLQEFGGRPVIKAPAAPYNLVLFFLFFLFMFLAAWLGRNNFFIRFFASVPMTVLSLIYLFIFSLVAGVLPQDNAAMNWPYRVMTSWPFVLSLFLLLANLALTTFRRLFLKEKAKLRFVLVHGGILITMVAMALGSSDFKRLRVTLSEGGMSRSGYFEQDLMMHNPEPLPFALSLTKFSIDYFDEIESPKDPLSGKTLRRAKSYRSEIKLFVKDRQPELITLEVNRPYQIEGWTLYQAGYDESVSIIDAIRDPWLPVVYSGFFIFLAGLVLFFWNGFGASFESSLSKRDEL